MLFISENTQETCKYHGRWKYFEFNDQKFEPACKVLDPISSNEWSTRAMHHVPREPAYANRIECESLEPRRDVHGLRAGRGPRAENHRKSVLDPRQLVDGSGRRSFRGHREVIERRRIVDKERGKERKRERSARIRSWNVYSLWPLYLSVTPC